VRFTWAISPAECGFEKHLYQNTKNTKYKKHKTPHAKIRKYADVAAAYIRRYHSSESIKSDNQ
jgi:hypothetical protein